MINAAKEKHEQAKQGRLMGYAAPPAEQMSLKASSTKSSAPPQGTPSLSLKENSTGGQLPLSQISNVPPSAPPKDDKKHKEEKVIILQTLSSVAYSHLFNLEHISS